MCAVAICFRNDIKLSMRTASGVTSAGLHGGFS